ncbi:MAG: hypothetical protein AAGA65_25545 [Actinomycetota bacterium]
MPRKRLTLRRSARAKASESVASDSARPDATTGESGPPGWAIAATEAPTAGGRTVSAGSPFDAVLSRELRAPSVAQAKPPPAPGSVPLDENLVAPSSGEARFDDVIVETPLERELLRAELAKPTEADRLPPYRPGRQETREPVTRQPHEPSVGERSIDRPALKRRARQTPTIEPPVLDQPTRRPPVIDQPERSVPDHSAIDQPVVERLVPDLPAIDQPVPESSVLDQSVPDHSAIDQPVIEPSVLDQPVDELFAAPTIERRPIGTADGIQLGFWDRYDEAVASADLFAVPTAAVTAIVGALDVAAPVAARCRQAHWVTDCDVYVLTTRPELVDDPTWTVLKRPSDVAALLDEGLSDFPLIVVDIPGELPSWIRPLTARLRAGGVGLVRYVLDDDPSDEDLATWHGELGRPSVLDLAAAVPPARVLDLLDRGEPIASVGGMPITADLLLAFRLSG